MAQPYQPTLAHHFLCLNLAAEAQSLWESDDPDAPDLENLFAIPRQYYDELYFGSGMTPDEVVDTVHNEVQNAYTLAGVARYGAAALQDPAAETNDSQEFESFQQLWQSITHQATVIHERVTDEIRYAISAVLMGTLLKATDGSHSVLVTRGTITPQEWLNNADFALVPVDSTRPALGRVHRGFRNIYRGLGGDYNRWLTEQTGQVYIVGHSLGGAVSQLAALDYLHTNPDARSRVAVYTFGAPRVGDDAFAASYNATVETSYRIVNTSDVVPYIPFDGLGELMGEGSLPYTHTKGERAYLHQTGNPLANHVGSYYDATEATAVVNATGTSPVWLEA